MIECTVRLEHNDGLDIGDLRTEIEDFLDSQTGCKVLGSGRSLFDESSAEIELKFRTRDSGERIVDRLRETFSERCEIEIDWPEDD